MVWEDLSGMKGRLEQFIEDSKKNLSIEPSEEEISQTRSKRGLLCWYKKCNELKLYLKKHGHCNVPQRDTKFKQLGRWVKNQRTDIKLFEAGAGLKTSMTDQKIEHLEDMGFQWNVRNNDDFWNQRYEELKKFKEEHGHCRVPRKSSGKLGSWVQNMRSIPQRPKCNEKIEKLKAVGLYKWSVKKEREDAMWNRRYEELKKFKEEHGHCRVPRSSGKLGIWVDIMRSIAHRPTCNEKIGKLMAVGFFDS